MAATTRKQKTRVAILGGKGMNPSYYGFGKNHKVRIYRSPKDGSELDAIRLAQSIKRGTIDLVVILTRFNAHTVTQRIRRICRNYNVTVEMRRSK